MFAWRGLTDSKRKGHTVWALFPANSDYFGAKKQQAMINYRVKNLQKTLAQLRKERVKVAKKVEEFEYGKFAWVFDPEGNKIELWEPPRNYRTVENQFPSE
ncbi:MAG TPA: VOC family protein [Candidatus Dormibacteraeota bacterium]|nr:VOC family protein [Candidatus Dormibacteraeota bacterium]